MDTEQKQKVNMFLIFKRVDIGLTLLLDQRFSVVVMEVNKEHSLHFPINFAGVFI